MHSQQQGNNQTSFKSDRETARDRMPPSPLQNGNWTRGVGQEHGSRRDRCYDEEGKFLSSLRYSSRQPLSISLCNFLSPVTRKRA